MNTTLKFFILVFVCFSEYLPIKAEARNKDYKLPDNVPAELQADNFLLIRKDFASFYFNYYGKEDLQPDVIQVTDVDYYGLKKGYALVFSFNLPNGECVQFGLCDGEGIKMDGQKGTVSFTCDVKPDMLYFSSTKGNMNCQLENGYLRINALDKGRVILITGKEITKKSSCLVEVAEE